MSTLRVDTITDEAGTGAPNFPSGINVSGGTVTGIDTNPLKYTAVSGATQALDVGSHNFFDAGTLTADTTVSFSNVPTEARWTYTAIGGEVATSFDLQTASFNNDFSLLSQASNGWGIFIGNSGSKMYMSDGGGNVFQYTLQTLYDVSSASYDNVVKSVFIPSNVEAFGLYFSTDGTQMYVSSNTSATITQWTLSTPWDLSTASSAGKSSAWTSYVTYGRGITFKPDGTKGFYCDQSGDVVQFNLSTAWDISTAGYAGNATGLPNVNGIAFNSGGTEMYLTYGTGVINVYALSTAWDARSYTLTASVSMSGLATSTGLYVNDDNLTIYVISTGLDSVRAYTSTEPATITFPSSVQNLSSSTPSVGSRKAYTFFTNDGGTTVWQDGAF